MGIENRGFQYELAIFNRDTTSNRIIIQDGGILSETMTLVAHSGLDSYQFAGTLNVPSGITLTVAPSATLRQPNMAVAGHLDMVGTAEQKITLVPITAASRFEGIQIEQNGTAEIAQVIFQKGKNCIHLTENGSATITYADMSDCNSNVLHLEDNSQAIINLSTLAIDNNFGVRNETGTIVDARLNYWGLPGGPTHTSNPTGSGVAVTDLVDFAPFL